MIITNSTTKKTIFFLFLIIIIGCKTKINQTIDKQKEGIWIELDTIDKVYKTIGKYKKNQEIGTWKYYSNNKLIRKEKYKNNICKTKFYHPNGKLEKKGFTKSETKNNLLHWFYFGKWKFYDTNRKYLKTSIYTNGKTADSLNANYNEIKMRFK